MIRNTDRKEPTQREIDDFVAKYLRVHRRVKEASGPHVISNCPACGKPKMLYLNTESGLWDCKHGSCNRAGNLFQLADIVGVRVRDAPIAVVNGKAAMLGGDTGGVNMKPAKAVAAPPKDAPHCSLERVQAGCDRLFAEGDEHGGRVRTYLHERGFDDETIRRFHLGVIYIRVKDCPNELAVAIPYVDSTKVTLVKMRNLEHEKAKRKFSRLAGGASSLFNVEGVRGLKQVVLVEAELDAVSLWQLGITNVASTSLGAKKNIPDEWLADLKDAEDIVLWYDDDEAGQDAVQVLMTQLGTHRCRIAKMPDGAAGKDANDLLKKMGDDAAPLVRQIVKDAKGIDNLRIVRPSHYGDHLMSQINQGSTVLGVSTGWPALDRLLRGIRMRELTLITGHTGHGKTQFSTALVQGLSKRGYPCGVVSLENGPISITRALFQTAFGHPISSIDDDEKREEAARAIAGLDDDPIFIVDREGRATIDELCDDIRYMRRRHGVRFVTVDHLHFLKKAHPRIDDHEHLSDSMKSLQALTRELDIHIFLIAHPKGMGEDEMPNGDTVKGTSAAKQDCDNGITVYRARDKTGAATTKPMKIKTPSGQRIEVELGPRDALIDLWKTRDLEAQCGNMILEFNRKTLCYTEKDTPAQAGQETGSNEANQSTMFADDPWAN